MNTNFILKNSKSSANPATARHPLSKS